MLFSWIEYYVIYIDFFNQGRKTSHKKITGSNKQDSFLLQSPFQAYLVHLINVG